MNKKILSILLAAALLLGMTTGAVAATCTHGSDYLQQFACRRCGAHVVKNGETYTVTDHSNGDAWSKLEDDGSGSITLYTGKNYYLDKDISLDITLNNDELNYCVVICLNGHTLSLTDSLEVDGNTELIICDCQGGGIITQAPNTTFTPDAGIYVTYGTLDLTSGSIQGFEGHGVWLDGTNAAMNMQSGSSISDNDDAGVYMFSESEFYMYGGIITQNRGGGVFNASLSPSANHDRIDFNNDSKVIANTGIVENNTVTMNVYSYEELINFFGLTEGASIGVTAPKNEVFGTGPAYNAHYIFPDKGSSYIISVDGTNYSRFVDNTWTIDVDNYNNTPWIHLGEETQFSATASNSGNSGAIPDIPITWSSNNENVATVDNNGKVTAVGFGNAHIYAHLGNLKSQHYRAVEVIPRYNQITLNRTTNGSRTVKVDGNDYIEYKNYNEGATVTVYPRPSTNYTLDAIRVYKTDDSSTTVAVAADNSFIMPGYAVTIDVTFKPLVVESVKIKQNPLTLEKGKGQYLDIEVTPSNAPYTTVAWSSDNESVATLIGGSNYVKAVAPGTAIITVTVDGIHKGSCIVNVLGPSLNTISVTKQPNKTTYFEGDYFDPTGMVVQANYVDYSTEDITTGYTYTPNRPLTSSDTFVKISYTKDGITRTYELEITVDKRPTISIDEKPQTYTYDGNSHPFDLKTTLSGFTVKYKSGSNWTDEVPKDAGTYDVKITRAAQDSYADFDKELIGALIINPKPVAVPTVSGSYTYNGAPHQVQLTGYVSSIMEISGDIEKTNAGNYYVLVQLSDSKNYVWNDDTDGTERAIAWTIDKSKPDAPAPTNVVVTAPTAPNAADGQITVDSGMEYRIQGDTEWTKAEGSTTITNLKAGDVYEIRFAETDNQSASEILVVTIPQCATFSVTIESSAGGEVTVTPTTAAAGETISFTVTPDSGMRAKEIKITAANGEYVNDVDYNGYTFTMPASDVTVSVTFVGEPVSVIFNANEGTVNLTTKTVTYDSTYGELPTPTRTGYTFVGWFTAATDGVEVTSNTTVKTASEHTLYAHWAANTYTISASADPAGSGTVTGAGTYVEGDRVKVTATPNEGYVFMGWYDEYNERIYDWDNSGDYAGAEYTFTVTENTTLTAKFAKGYTASVAVPGTATISIEDESLDRITVAANERVYLFTNGFPIVTDANGDSIIVGEYPNPILYSFLMPKSDVTIYVQYDVSVDSEIVNGEVLTDPSKTAIAGSKVIIVATPDSGYKISGLPRVSRVQEGPRSLSNDGFDATPVAGQANQYSFTMPAYNVSVSAEFSIAQYKVTLIPNGGNIAEGKDVTSYTYNVGATLPTDDDITWTGYRFDGWFDNKDCTGTAVTEIGKDATDDKTFYAKWTANQYTITFETGEGSEVAAIKQDYGTSVSAPEDPTREGWKFLGWADKAGNDVAFPLTMPVDGMTLTAKWTPNTTSMEMYSLYSVNHYLEQANGSYAAAEEEELLPGKVGETVTAEAKTYEGYTLNAAKTISSAQVVQAGPDENGKPALTKLEFYYDLNSYTITFDTDGGSAVASITQDYGTAVTAPADPTKTGYTFAGWDVAVPETMPAENLTITAKWTVNQYEVTLKPDGGSINSGNVTNYTYGVGATLPTDVTKAGYAFGGWYADKACTGTAVTEITAADTGDKTFYAKWIKYDKLTVTNGEKETNVFTYGETIYVYAGQAGANAGLMTLAFDEPAAGEMVLLYGEKQISNPAPMTNGTYMLTYDTTKKLLPIGKDLELTLRCITSDSHYDQKLTITLLPKELTVTVKAKNRMYNPELNTVEIQNVKLDAINVDDVVLKGAEVGMLANNQVGEYTSLTLPETAELTGSDASFYMLPEAAMVDPAVKINAANPSELIHKTEITLNFTELFIPEDMPEDVDTIEEIKSVIMTRLSEIGLVEPNTLLCDATLHYSEDGGKTWIKATPEHFPASGKLTVTMPVPKGTHPDKHDYTVVHMFTTDAFGKKAGEMEVPDVFIVYDEKGNPMLSFEVTGLSPIMVAWTEKPNADALPQTGDNSQLMLWFLLMGLAGAGMYLLRKRAYN